MNDSPAHSVRDTDPGLEHELRRANEQLRQSEERYRTLINEIEDYAIYRTDIEGRPTTWNEGVKRVLGFDEADFIGLDLSTTIFTKEDQESGAVQRELDQAAAAGKVINDRWMVRRDGTRFYATGITTAPTPCLLLNRNTFRKSLNVSPPGRSESKSGAENCWVLVRPNQSFL